LGLFVAVALGSVLFVTSRLAGDSSITGAAVKETKMVLLDIKVGEETVFHTGTKDAVPARVTLPDGLRLELLPRTTSDMLDLLVWAVTVDPISRDEKRAILIQTRLAGVYCQSGRCLKVPHDKSREEKKLPGPPRVELSITLYQPDAPLTRHGP
jgi:hypothetical protein